MNNDLRIHVTIILLRKKIIFVYEKHGTRCNPGFTLELLWLNDPYALKDEQNGNTGKPGVSDSSGVSSD